MEQLIDAAEGRNFISGASLPSKSARRKRARSYKIVR
jgi:hypothetical protein